MKLWIISCFLCTFFITPIRATYIYEGANLPRPTFAAWFEYNLDPLQTSNCQRTEPLFIPHALINPAPDIDALVKRVASQGDFRLRYLSPPPLQELITTIRGIMEESVEPKSVERYTQHIQNLELAQTALQPYIRVLDPDEYTHDYPPRLNDTDMSLAATILCCKRVLKTLTAHEQKQSQKSETSCK
jgi:hypothetical protein